MSTLPCPKITAALHEVMSRVGYVQKKGRNDFHRYNYAGEKDLLEVLRPAMVEAGLLLLPSVTQAIGPDEYGNTHVRVEYTLAHKDGEVWPEKIVAMGCGNDKNSKGGIGDKGTYKAITGANKYLLFKLFQIETGDDPETDERETDPPSRQPANQKRSNDQQALRSTSALKEGIEGCQTPEEVGEYWKEHKPQLDALPDDLFNEVKAFARDRKAALTMPMAAE